MRISDWSSDVCSSDLVSCLSLLTVPAVNSLTRIGEAQADAYALRTTNLPGALASALLKTAEYRYPRPYPWQALVFYNHPSVEKRVLAAMEWKAAHRDRKSTRLNSSH